jgi:hypothetical protein
LEKKLTLILIFLFLLVTGRGRPKISNLFLNISGTFLFLVQQHENDDCHDSSAKNCEKEAHHRSGGCIVCVEGVRACACVRVKIEVIRAQ